MKRIGIAVGLLVLGGMAFRPTATAQDAPKSNVTAEQVNDNYIQLMRQDIRSKRKQIVAANLPLTDTEATKFWPLYDQYAADAAKIYDTRLTLIKEYATNYTTLTDAQAVSLAKRWIGTDESIAQLRLKWIPQFEKVISGKKTATFFQIDNRTAMLVDLQVSAQIPLVQPQQ